MANLLAYIPVLNQRHLDWFAQHRRDELWLVSQEMAQTLLPRLGRNIGAIPTEIQVRSIRNLPTKYGVKEVLIFDPKEYYPNLRSPDRGGWIMADEDICHEVDQKYFQPLEITPVFETIWARYDMGAVKKSQPVIPDCEVSMSAIDFSRILKTDEIARQSPDWWRQIGVMAFRNDELLAIGWNEHFPTEYETDIFMDPRVNFDAGDPLGNGVYLSLHAEEALICFCANGGPSLRGASVYINTFPCGNCARALSRSGIKELIFREGSSFLSGFEIMQNAGIRIIQVRRDPGSA